MRIFINGVMGPAVLPKTGNVLASSVHLRIGRWWVGGGAGDFYHGFMDDPSVYDRALSNQEIADMANDLDARYEYHHTNALGSNIVLTDDGENVLVRYEYDVFGARRNEVGTSENPRKFTGKEWEADVGLYYFAARYYDPYIGRFTSRDPIGDGGNWYAYVENNPLKFVDPTGTSIVEAFRNWIADLRRALGLPDPNNPLPPTGNPLPGMGDPVVGLSIGPNPTQVFRPLISSIVFAELIDLLWDFVSPGEVDTTGEFLDKIKEEGGYSELGKPGSGRDTRHIEGNKGHAEAFFWRLANGREVTKTTQVKNGQTIETFRGTDPSGNDIVYRPASRGSLGTEGYDGPPSIDINDNGKKTKLKFTK